MKKYIISILLLVATVLSYKALATDSDYNKYIPIMTPESAALGQYGAFPVSLYTGSIDISIPIHTLKTNNIFVPISLQYNGTGFIPNKDCGKIGHDWALVAGGAITRSVNGVPDEWVKTSAISNDNPDYDLSGMLSYIRSGNPILSNDDIRNLQHLDLASQGWETTPDIFSFNFCGHSGQFMIDHDGSVKVIGEEAYKVDITGLAPQYYDTPTAVSSIVITDGYGTKYTFGGNIHSLEVNLKRHPYPPADTYIKNGVISAFYLSRIETSDGEYVEFVYCETNNGNDESSYSNFNSIDGHSNGENIIRNPYYADYYQNISKIGNSEVVYNPKGSLMLSFTKGVFLHKIITSHGEEILFTYSPRQRLFCNVTVDDFWNHGEYNTPKLDKIEIINSTGALIGYTTLHQSYKEAYDWESGNANPYLYASRMFLDSVFVNQQKYSIEYSNTENLPFPYTRGIDLQGYYNGNDSNPNLLGITNTNEDIDFSNRQASFEHASKGMIKKITYPTGGSTEFVFENHTCSTAVTMNLQSGALPGLYTVACNSNVGGLRIKQIANTPGETITYDYCNTDGTTSSGVFNDTKRYNLNVGVTDPVWEVTGLTIYSGNNILAGNTVSEPEIGYSRVVERRGSGNGYKVYNFTTFKDFMDEPVLENDAATVGSYSATNQDIASAIWHTSLHLDRGKLLRTEEYAENGTMLKETVYSYDNDPSRRLKAIYSSGYRLYLLPATVANSVAHYYYPKHVISRTVNEYINGICHTTITGYTYNRYNQLVSRETITNSNGDINVRKLYYPKDFPTDTTLSAMAAQNMLNTIVKEEYYCNGILNRTVENKFSSYDGNAASPYYDICAIKEMDSENSSYCPVRIHSRGKNRNIESITEFGKPAAFYLWGYGYQYPVAKLENITLEEFEAKLPTSTRDAMAANFRIHETGVLADSTHRVLLDSLNGANYFPDAHITLYKYKPQVGMTYCKEPNGLEHFYEYDVWGRLKRISQCTESDVIKNYEYNTVYNSDLKASWEGASSSLFTGMHTLNCTACGGTKDYTYSLKLMRGFVQIGSSTTNQIEYNFTTEGTYTFSGTVTDNITKEVSEFSYTFSVIEPQVIEFSNINKHVTVDHGCYTSSAIIRCENAVTVTFFVMSEVEMLSGNTSYGINIADHYYLSENDEWPEKDFTLELQPGDNIVEIYMNNIIGNGNIEITISGVEGEENILGENLYLSLSTDKVEK